MSLPTVANPVNTARLTAAVNNTISIETSTNQGGNPVSDWRFGYNGILQLPNGAQISDPQGNLTLAVGGTTQAVIVSTYDSSGGGQYHYWNFNSQGGLVFPNGTVQTTAYTGGGGGAGPTGPTGPSGVGPTGPTGAAANTGNIAFTGDAVYDLNGIIVENADLSHGASAALLIPANGSSDAVQVNNFYGPVTIGTGSGLPSVWQFDSTGNLLIPDSGHILAPNNIYVSTLDGVASIDIESDQVHIIQSGNDWGFYSNGTMGFPSNATIQSDNSFNLLVYGNSYSTWSFGQDGSLTLPSSGNIITTNGNLNINSTSGWVNITSGPHTFTFDADSVGRFIMPSQGVIAGDEQGVRVFAGNLASEAGNVWTFGYGGTLEIPDKGIIRTQNWDSFSLQSDNTNISIIPNVDQTQGWTFGYNGILTLPHSNYLQTIDPNLTMGSQGYVRINSNAATGGGTYGWVFGEDGSTTFPNGAKLNNGTAYQFATDNGVVDSLDLRDTSGRGFYTNGSGYTLRSNGSYNWVFGTDGSLTFPNVNSRAGAGVGSIFDGPTWRAGLNIQGAADNSPVLIYNYGADGKGFGASAVYIQHDNVQIITNNQRSGGPGLTWQFDRTGNLTLPAGGSVTFPDSSSQTTAYKRNTGSWTVATGSDSYSFTVPENGTYVMWVRGNIPNGIITWNATATVTNTNVPVLGQQFAWNYTGGGTPLEITAIPDQFVGTPGVIVSSNPSVSSTTNQFRFTINNTSGTAQTVYWGYVTQ